MIYEMRYLNKVICDGEDRNDVIRRGENFFRLRSWETGMNYVSVEIHDSSGNIEDVELEFYVDQPDYYDTAVRLYDNRF